LSRSGREEHIASGGSCFAQIFVGIANAAASASELIAKFRVEISLNNLDAAPIAGKLLGNDHGEGRAHALPHLGFAAPDFHAAIGGKLEPGVWRKGMPVRGFKKLAAARSTGQMEW
jgi:hypothetical protein